MPEKTATVNDKHITPSSVEKLADEAKRKTHWPRPTGEEDRYLNVNKWSYRKWAWEYLRRNDDFIAECERIVNCADEDESLRMKDSTAAKFGLHIFKNYKSGFINGPPKFIADRFAVFSKPERGTKSISVGFEPGDVIIRFHVGGPDADSSMLTKQIEYVTGLLSRRAKRLNSANSTKTRKHNVGPAFGIYLRLLDAEADGKTPEEYSFLIDPKSHDKNLSYHFKKNAIDLAKKQLSTAKEYTKTGYRHLCILKGKPVVRIKLSGTKILDRIPAKI